MSTVHSRVANAIRAGRMSVPAACEACGREQYTGPNGRIVVIWHHWSYAPKHATDCIALCRGCHALVHQGLLAEPRTGRMYPLCRASVDAAAKVARVQDFLRRNPGARARDIRAEVGSRGATLLSGYARAGSVVRVPSGLTNKRDRWLYFAPTPT